MHIYTKRSTEDVISTARHLVFTHLEQLHQNAVDFNTISPMNMIGKLNTLAVNTTKWEIGLPHKQTPDSLD